MGQPKPVDLDDDFENVFADELEPGHELMQGQYIIESFLNAGGFGITYRAKDSLDRPVVIKECFPGSFCRRTTTSVQPRSRAHKRELSSIVGLFVQEARSLARLNHPNIVGVHQVFEENNTAYMALDFVEGRDLLDRIENPDDMLEPDQIEAMLKKLLNAVGFIHDQGILHRDISPDNVLLKPDLEPILIDFGAAREEASQQSRVLSALRVVKDGYSPQEFYISGSEQGPFSDLYALGATFYHLITGELPANSQARLAAVAGGDADPYQPVADRMPAYSERFLKGIDKSLEILPKDRIESAEKWLALLDGSADFNTDALAGGAKTAARGTKGKSSKKPLLLASVALMVPFAGFVIMSSGKSPEAVVETPVSAPAPAAEEAAPEVVAAEPAPEVNAVAAALALQAAAAAAAAEAQASAAEAVSEPAVVEEAAPVVSAPEETPALDAITAPAGTQKEISATTGVADGPALYSVAQRYGFGPANAQAEPVETADVTSLVAPDASFSPQVGLEFALRPQLRPEIEAIPSQIVPQADADVTLPTLAAQPFVEATSEAPPVVDEATAALPVPRVDPALLEVFELSKVLSGWTVELPAEVTAAESSLYSVNGVDVASQQDLDSLMSKRFAAPVEATLEVDVLSGATRDDAQVQTITAPVLQRTLFLNGLFFETRFVEGAWQTEVIAAPQNRGIEYRAGDIIVGDLATGTPFNKRTSLPELLKQAVAQNRDVVTLAVRREGQVLTLDLQTPN